MGGREGIAPPFLTPALDVEWSASRPCRITPGIHWIGGWVGPTVSLDAVEKRKILHCRELNAGTRARSPSLYRLRVLYNCKGIKKSVTNLQAIYIYVHGGA
jgi:hypothetical protein